MKDQRLVDYLKKQREVEKANARISVLAPLAMGILGGSISTGIDVASDNASSYLKAKMKREPSSGSYKKVAITDPTTGDIRYEYRKGDQLDGAQAPTGYEPLSVFKQKLAAKTKAYDEQGRHNVLTNDVKGVPVFASKKDRIARDIEGITTKRMKAGTAPKDKSRYDGLATRFDAKTKDLQKSIPELTQSLRAIEAGENTLAKRMAVRQLLTNVESRLSDKDVADYTRAETLLASLAEKLNQELKGEYNPRIVENTKEIISATVARMNQTYLEQKAQFALSSSQGDKAEFDAILKRLGGSDPIKLKRKARKEAKKEAKKAAPAKQQFFRGPDNKAYIKKADGTFELVKKK